MLCCREQSTSRSIGDPGIGFSCSLMKSHPSQDLHAATSNLSAACRSWGWPLLKPGLNQAAWETKPAPGFGWLKKQTNKIFFLGLSGPQNFRIPEIFQIWIPHQYWEPGFSRKNWIFFKSKRPNWKILLIFFKLHFNCIPQMPPHARKKALAYQMWPVALILVIPVQRPLPFKPGNDHNEKQLGGFSLFTKDIIWITSHTCLADPE